MRLFIGLLALASLAYAAPETATGGSFWETLTQVNADQVKALAASHMWLALLLCFASGVLTSLTPCVYPMIPITINIFGRMSRERSGEKPTGAFDVHTFLYSGIYVAGMCATYSIMGVAAGLTGSLFGKVLQSPYMLGFLTLLFLALAMGQLGAFKMALPGSLQTKLATVGNAQSGFGIFIMGLFSGLIVSPCVGPVIAGILAFTFDTSNALIGMLYFFSFSLGLGVLFLLIGGFSGVLSKLPRSGAWMTRINRVLAALMLIAATYYGSLLYKQLRPAQPVAATSSSLIPWLTDEAEALRVAQSTQKPILLDFSAEWCAACHEIDHQIFHDPLVVEKMKNFIPLRLDVTQDNDANSAFLKKYGVQSLPTLVFIKPGGEILVEPRIHGLIPTAQFIDALNKVSP